MKILTILLASVLLVLGTIGPSLSLTQATVAKPAMGCSPCPCPDTVGPRHVDSVLVPRVKPECGGGGGGAPPNPCSYIEYNYASGIEDDGYASFGVQGTQVIYGQSLCSSSYSGSGVAKYVNVYFGPVTSFTGWVSLGYYQGWNSEGTHYAASPGDYYLEVCSNINDCPSSDYQWYDLSTSSGVYPTAGSTVTFILSSTCYPLLFSCPIPTAWTYLIIVSGNIVKSGEFFAPGEYGSANAAIAESHNNDNTLTAKFTGLSTQLADGAMVPWAASYATSSSPYNAEQCSTTEFVMWTSGYSAPSC